MFHVWGNSENWQIETVGMDMEWIKGKYILGIEYAVKSESNNICQLKIKYTPTTSLKFWNMC